MSNSQKEGIIILCLSIISALICCLISNWGSDEYGILVTFMNADVGWSYYLEIDQEFYTPFKFELVNVLSLFLVVLIYGILRSLNIIRRLFAFESQLAKLIPTRDDSEY